MLREYLHLVSLSLFVSLSLSLMTLTLHSLLKNNRLVEEQTTFLVIVQPMVELREVDRNVTIAIKLVIELRNAINLLLELVIVSIPKKGDSIQSTFLLLKTSLVDES